MGILIDTTHILFSIRGQTLSIWYPLPQIKFSSLSLSSITQWAPSASSLQSSLPPYYNRPTLNLSVTFIAPSTQLFTTYHTISEMWKSARGLKQHKVQCKINSALTAAFQWSGTSISCALIPLSTSWTSFMGTTRRQWCTRMWERESTAQGGVAGRESKSNLMSNPVDIPSPWNAFAVAALWQARRDRHLSWLRPP